MKSLLSFGAIACLFCLIVESRAQEGDVFSKLCADLAKKNEGERTVKGAAEGWLFLQTELEHVGAGAFWDAGWEATVSKKDPVPVFAKIQEQLKAMDVEFLLVPVPSKALLQTAELTGKAMPVTSRKPFYDRFRKAGIEVLDTETLFAAKGKEAAVYCAQDTHPTPFGCEVLAGAIHEALKGRDWVKRGAGWGVGEAKTISIAGDLITETIKLPKEELKIRRAGKKDAAGVVTPVDPYDAKSSVVMVGDSHALVFSEGGTMHAKGAGVPDHLQAKLGMPVFVAATRASASQAWKQCYKGPEFWEGKKVVVWLMTERSFTRERRWWELPRLPR